MNSFRDTYLSAVNSMEEFHGSAAECMDKTRHKKRVFKRVRRAAATVFSTVTVLFLCGFGTVRAAEYIQSVIRVQPWGFESMDAAGSEQTYILDEQIEHDMEGAVIDNEFTPFVHISSWEEFNKSEDIIFPQPSILTEGDTQGVDVSVIDDQATVIYTLTDGRTLCLERIDYSGTEGHRSARIFAEGVCNEREYTTGQGYTYTLADSVRGSKSEPLKIHAVTVAGNYEVFADFEGYTQEEAESILDSIDLSLYE